MDFEFIGDSSCIEKAGFQQGFLTVVFQDGSVYTYSGVSPYVWRSFKMSTSRGWWFNKNIRNNYSFSPGYAPELPVNTRIYDKVLQGIDEAIPQDPEYFIE